MATALPVATDFTGAGVTEGQFKTAITSLRAAIAEMGDPSARYGLVQNLSIVATVAANALTIALKDRAGADPSANSPVSFPFRNVTVATGDFSVLNLSAAHSLVISSGSTLGATSGVAFRLWVVMFNDGGTLRLGVINCLSGTDIFPLGQVPIASSTAEGGAGAADSAHVLYTGTAVTSKAYIVLGYLEWQTGLATAGTWNAAPTIGQLFGPNVPLPGATIQAVGNSTGAVATGTTVIPNDDTIPQNTEGDQYMSQAITPRCAANVLRVRVQLFFEPGGGALGLGALFQDSVANALAAVLDTNTTFANTYIEHEAVAGGVAATTFKARAGRSGAGTTTFNGTSSARKLGGALNSFIRIEEVQA